MRLSISPSIVDSVAYFLDTDFRSAEAEAAKLEEVRAQVRGDPFEPSEAMLRGRAWHDAIEDVLQRQAAGLRELPSVLSYGDFRIDAGAVITIVSELPPITLTEHWGRLDLPELNVEMHLRTDGLYGNRIDEHKTTSRIDVDRYVATCQWRAYLLAFEAQLVVYHVVKLKRDRRTNVWGLKEYLPFRQYAYPGMRRDLLAQVARAKQFIVDQGLQEHRRVR